MDGFTPLGPDELVPRSYAGILGQIGSEEDDPVKSPETRLAEIMGTEANPEVELPSALEAAINRIETIKSIPLSPDVKPEVNEELEIVKKDIRKVGLGRASILGFLKRFKR